MLDTLRANGRLSDGIPLPEGGGRVRVASAARSVPTTLRDSQIADHLILMVALDVRDFSKDEYDASAKEADAAFSLPGAMERPVAVSYGPVPAEVYAGHRFVDVLIHGWDLAKATGQSTSLDPELVESCWSVINPQMELLRGSGMFGDQLDVPDDADPQTKLLTTLGRRA